MYLLTASGVSSILFNAPELLPSTSLFPHYASIISLFIGSFSPASAGTEHLALIDAVLALYDCLDNRNPGIPDTIDVFREMLQRLSLLSANTPNAALRYRAHEIMRRVLYSHPDEGVRLAYIKDTLENCPYENLKASAVGWLKDETVSAGTLTGGEVATKSVFATPTALTTAMPYLFTDPKSLVNDGDFTPFLAHQSFFLAVLNLMYLILSSKTLNVSSWDLLRALETWLGQLKSVSSDIRYITEVGQAGGEDTIEGLQMDLGLLDGNIAMVEVALEEVRAADKSQGRISQ